MTFFNRRDWGARPAKWVTALPHQPATHVYVHHSVTGNPKTDAAQIQTVRSIQAQHLNGNFADIAYSFLVAKGGGDSPPGSNANRFQGRGWGVQSGATGGRTPQGISNDAYSYSICAIGNFHDVHKANNLLIDAIVRQIRNGIRKGYIVERVKVRGHRDVYATACPGDALYARVPEIQKRSRQGW